MSRHLSIIASIVFLMLAAAALPARAQLKLPAELPGPGPGRGDSVTHAGHPVTAAAADSISGDTLDYSGTVASMVDSLAMLGPPPISELRILAGGAIPSGIFGQQDGSHPGFAHMGFTVGLDYVISGKTFGWISSVLGSRNPSDIPSTHRAVYISLDLPPTTNVEVGPWYTIWTGSGLQMKLPQFFENEKVSLHVMAQLGILLARSSNVDYYIEGVQFQQSPVWAASASGTFGLDVEVADRLFVVGRYMTSTPTFDLDTRGPNDFVIHNLYDQPTSIFQLLVGITI